MTGFVFETESFLHPLIPDPMNAVHTRQRESFNRFFIEQFELFPAFFRKRVSVIL